MSSSLAALVDIVRMTLVVDQERAKAVAGALLDRTRVTEDIIAGRLLAAGLALYAIELES